MNNLLIRDFLEKRYNLNEKEYLLYTIAYNIAPTFMGVKPATLINIAKDLKNSYAIWENNREFICKELNIKAWELKKTNRNIFILFYNNELLFNVLNKEEVKNFLFKFSYNVSGGVDSILNCLEKRFIKGCPSEIGVFLGIPLEDVEDYINNSGENYKLLGYWKVYNNTDKAKMIFNLYERSKEVVIINILNSMEKG